MIVDVATHLLSWIVRWLGVRTLLAAALLLVALGSVALGLADVVYGLDAGLLLPVAASGMLVGWGLARSPLPGWLGGVLAFVWGAEAILLRVGRLGGPLMALLRSLADLAWGVLSWPLDGPPDGSLAVSALAELWAGGSTLLARLRDWSVALARGQAAFDPVATALVWSLALWVAAVWAGWAVRRRDWALQAITPAGALLAVSLAYAGGSHYFLAPLLGAMWLLWAFMGHHVRERHWQAAGIDFSLDIRFELTMAAIGLSLTLMTVAVLLPSVSIQQAVQFAQRLLAERASEGKQAADSLGLKQGSPTTFFDPVRVAGLPRRHLLGSGPELSQQVVMVVYPDEVRLEAAPGQPLPHSYWRSLTYDRYNGRGWYTGETETVEYEAGELASFEGLSAAPPFHRTVRQKVQVMGDPSAALRRGSGQALEGLLYAVGHLVTADHGYSVAWRAPGDAFGAQIGAKVYRADSLLPLVSEAQLRSAGSDYPGWVRDHYLALPGEVPARVLALARDLTATEPTSYDRARAIERYLRTFPYTLDLPAPPPDRDAADYFLFDLRQGYCDYYATAMVVLARAAGLPARLVIGYASGTYDATQARYVVTEADAHAWAEVYFPGCGWIEFEPTSGRPPIERPEAIVAEISEPGAALKPLTGGRLQMVRLALLGLLGALAALALGGVAWWAADGWRLGRMLPLAAVATVYQRLYRHGQWLAVPARAGNTPYEFAAELVGRVAELAHGQRRGTVLASAVQEVRWLTDLYVRGLYSSHGLSAAEKAQAIQTWQRLRWRLWLAWMWQSSLAARPWGFLRPQGSKKTLWR